MGLLRLIRTAGQMLATRATPENPQFDLNDEASWDAFGVEDEGGGTKVSERTALTDSAWLRGITLISNLTAKVPIVVYERTEGGKGKERATEHPLYPLLRYQPNAEMTAFTLWQTRVGQALSGGNSYTLVVRDGSGKPIELIPIAREKCWPVRVNGALHYALAVRNKVIPVPKENILHFKGFGDDGLEGYPIWQKAKKEIGLGLAARQHGFSVFKNGAMPALILEHPGTMSEEAQKRFLKSWNERYSGAENAHKVAILEEALKAKPLSGMTAKDAQLLELRGLHTREIANFLGLPPHKLGDTTRTGYASLEQENQSLLDDTLDPWYVMIEQELRSKLLSEDEKRKDSHVIEFLREALVRADMAVRAEADGKALAGVPWQTVNEVRARWNLRPVPEGDKLIIPISVQSEDLQADKKGKKPAAPVPAFTAPAEDDDEGKKAKAEDGAQDEAPSEEASARRRRMLEECQRVLADARGRAMRRLGAQARRAAKSPVQLAGWMQRMASTYDPVIVDMIRPPATLCALAEERELTDGGASVVRGMLDRVHGALDAAARAAKPAEFESAISSAMAALEASA